MRPTAARTRTAEDRPSYRCTECGRQTAKWLGRCPECQARGTVEEHGAPDAGRVSIAALPIGQVDGRQATARSTGAAELDRVLGGGLVPGAVVLLAGEPGVGKSPQRPRTTPSPDAPRMDRGQRAAGL